MQVIFILDSSKMASSMAVEVNAMLMETNTLVSLSMDCLKDSDNIDGLMEVSIKVISSKGTVMGMASGNPPRRSRHSRDTTCSIVSMGMECISWEKVEFTRGIISRI